MVIKWTATWWDTGQDRVRIFYFVSFNTLNLCELNDIAQGKQGNFEEPLTHCKQETKIWRRYRSRLPLLTSSWLLNNAIYYFFFFRNFLFKLYWTYLLYLLYTVKVLLIEFLQHIFFDPSKVTSNPNRRWSLYFSRRIISILNVSFSIVTRSVIGYSCFNNSLYVFLLYSLNIYI